MKNFTKLIMNHASLIMHRFMTLLLLMTLGVGQVWAWTSFYLIGNFTGDNWSNDQTKCGISNHYDADGNSGRYFVDVEAKGGNQYFALYKTDGGNNRYRPSTNHTALYVGIAGVYGGYDNYTGDNSWAYHDESVNAYGTAGIIRVCINQQSGNSENWNDFPRVWIERPTVYLRHKWDSQNSYSCEQSGWGQSAAMTDNNDGTYTLIAKHSGNSDGYSWYTTYEGTHVNTETNGLSTLGSPQKGDKCQFIYNVTNHTVTVTRYETVTFKNGDETVATKELLYNGKTTAPSDPEKTGYTFEGWYDGDTKFTSELAITSDRTFTAKWKINSYDITYDPKTAVNCTYTTAPVKAEYNSQVYFVFTPNEGYVISSVAAVDASSNAVTVTKTSENNYSIANMPASNITVTVTAALSTLPVTYGVHSSGNGTLAAKVGEDGIGDSHANVAGGATVVFTATPSTGYEVEGWYTDADCTEGKHDAGVTSYTINSLSAAATVYVKFQKATYNITYTEAATGWSYGDKPANGQMGDAISFVVNPATGYTVTVKKGEDVLSVGENNTYSFTMPAEAVQINVSATEKTVTLTPTVDDEAHGTVSAAGSVGIATSLELTATKKDGYKFDHWVLSSNLSIQNEGTTTSNPITVKTNGDGAAVSAQAVFVEDLTTIWKLGYKVENAADNAWQELPFAKVAGQSTKSVGYYTLSLAAGTTYEFKVIDDTPGAKRYLGNNGTMTSNNCGWAEDGRWYFYEKEYGGSLKPNCKIQTTVAGNYEFMINFSGSDPYVAVTYPSSVTITPAVNEAGYGSVEPSVAFPVNTGSTVSLNNNVLTVDGKTITATATTATAQYTYAFSSWSVTNGTAISENTTITANFTRTTNHYTITWKNGETTLETDENVEYGATPSYNGSTPTKDEDVNYTYTHKGWDPAVASVTGNQIYTATFTATPKEFTITYNVNGGDAVTEHLTYNYETTTFSLPTPSKSGFAFRGWYTNEACTEGKTTEIAKGTTGNKTFYAKWKEEGWYLNYSADGSNFSSVRFSGEPLTAAIEVSQASHNYAMEIQKVVHAQTDVYYKNANYMTENNCTGWEYTTSPNRNGFTSSAKVGTYTFTITVNASGNPVVTLNYPTPDATLSIAHTSGSLYQGQKIVISPSTNRKGDMTVCYSFSAKPDGSTVSFTQEGKNVYFTPDLAGTYSVVATLHEGADGCTNPTLVTSNTLSFDIAVVPYELYITESNQNISLASGKAEVELAAGKEYSIKIHNGDTWYTNAGSSDALAVMDATNNTNWPFNNCLGSEANTMVATTIAGTYTFSLTIGEGGSRSLSITYPELPRQDAMDGTAVKANNPDVMIQAFYWAHDGNTSTDYTPFGSVKWADLDGKELGENFDLVWLAPSTVTADYTGYLPMNYSIQGEISDGDNGRAWNAAYHSPWGTEAQLKSLIADIHTGGGKAIADIVINHSTADGGSWCQWNEMKFGNSTNNTLYGSYTPDWQWVSRNDEMFLSKSDNQYGQKDQAGECGTKDLTNNFNDDFYVSNPAGGTYSWDYTEYNCTYSRDWAHQKREVREMARAYLLWMKNEIGYDGWRYDFAKGINGKFINEYNHASGAYFSVSELFEGDHNKLEGFILDAGGNSYVFDFPAKYNMMNNAIRNGWYQGLQGNVNNTMTYGNMPGSLSGIRKSRYTVTFVDNHDTFREGTNLSGHENQMPNSGNQVLQAHAYILSMPGVPCVFYPYWHEYKEEIKAMVWARKWTGVNSESIVSNEETADGKYLAVIHGTNGSIYLKLGPNAGVGECPAEYTKAYSGTNVGVYYKVDDASLVKPILSVDKESQEYRNTLDVKLTAKGAQNATYTIYYTTDGSEPTTSSSSIANGGTVTINGAEVGTVTTLKAFAQAAGALASNIVEYKYTKVSDKITLTAAPTSASVGATITLTPASESNTAYTYNFFVLEPGAANYTSCGTSTSTLNYVMQGEGYYQFYVTTSSTPSYTSNTVKVSAEPLVYWLHYKKNTEADNQAANWATVKMSANGDGTYYYYSDGSGQGSSAGGSTASVFYTGNGANAGIDADHNNNTYFKPSTGSETPKIENPDNLADGATAVWIYNAFEQTLKVNNPATKIYRIKVTLADGRDFYSNNIYQTGSAVDVSFYAQPAAELTLEYYGNGTMSWTELGSVTLPEISGNGVYTTTATITITAATAELPERTTCTLGTMTAYTGNYIISTPATVGEGKGTSADKSLTSFTPDAGNYYNHYYVAWIEAGQNTYGTVGNATNTNLAGAVGYYKLPGESPAGANVRYAYNPSTNVFTRTHLAGSTSGIKYLSTFGINVQDTTAEHKALKTATDGQILSDASNWMYATAVRVDQNGTGVASSLKLAAQFNGAFTYLLAADGLDSETAKRDLTTAGNSLGNYPQFGIIYDYKTNKIISGWNPKDATITSSTTVDHVMISRQDDEMASEFKIQSGQLFVAKQMVNELIITKSMWTKWGGYSEGDGENLTKRMHFWVSFPYPVRVSDIYGFGVCNTNWEVQHYRGDLRAAGTAGSTAWRRLKATATTEANRGYVFEIELKESDFKTVEVNGKDVSQVAIYFPSAGEVTLTPAPQTTLDDLSTGAAPAVQRDWHIMGVPLMATGGTVSGITKLYDKPFAKEGDRWYEPHVLSDKDFQLQAGHSYMVQGHGTLTWNYPEAAAPSRTVAREEEQAAPIIFRLNLMQDEELLDKTYMEYKNGSTREYDLGGDLEKIENAGRSMLYSELNQKLAVISLSDTDHVQIPLTVVASEAGEFTLQLSDEVATMDPVLYDAQEGTTTLLNKGAYTVELQAGTCKGRFFLGVQAKQPQTPTATEQVSATSSEVVKYLDPNGRLLILKQGHLYDAFGHTIR